LLNDAQTISAAAVFIKRFEDSLTQFSDATEKFFAAGVRKWGDESTVRLRENLLGSAYPYQRLLQDKIVRIIDARAVGGLNDARWGSIKKAISAIDITNEMQALDSAYRTFVKEIDKEDQRTSPLIQRALRSVRTAEQ
jgi:hypothetical protein